MLVANADQASAAAQLRSAASTKQARFGTNNVSENAQRLARQTAGMLGWLGQTTSSERDWIVRSIETIIDLGEARRAALVKLPKRSGGVLSTRGVRMAAREHNGVCTSLMYTSQCV